ncbi:MAG: helix-turn-helix domain-containing protein [Pseudonocardiaceae bacterium]
MAVGPTVQARVLGIELARLRNDAKIRQREAAAVVELSQGKIASIEAGRGAIKRGDLILLLQHYGADQETIDRLDELRLGAGTRGWWSVYKLPDQLDLYVGLEASAVSVRSLALKVIPGLLQTEEYARKLHSLRGRLTPEEVDQRVVVRMQRQQRLTGSSPLQLSVVLDEAALLRCARETSVAAGQLQQLLERAQLPNVEVRVIPFDTGLHVGTAGAYSLLSFPGGVLPDVANQEYVAGGHVIDDQTSVAELATIFGMLRGQALNHDESLTLIAELAENIK